jgi:hypothetical protein
MLFVLLTLFSNISYKIHRDKIYAGVYTEKNGNFRVHRLFQRQYGYSPKLAEASRSHSATKVILPHALISSLVKVAYSKVDGNNRVLKILIVHAAQARNYLPSLELPLMDISQQ